MDPNPARHGFGYRFRVAREHRDAKSHLVQVLNRLGGFRTDLVFGGDRAGKATVCDHVQYRPSGCGPRLALALHRARGGNASIGQHPRPAYLHQATVHQRPSADASDALESGRRGQMEAALPGQAPNRLRQRMLGIGLH